MDTETIAGYELQVGDFEGPMGKLLELIDSKELDITRVSLAEVTADFLDYINRLENKIERRELADFVVVAAKLVLIKSHSLLPSLSFSEEEEQDLLELEERLKLYRELKEAENAIQALWGEHRSFARPYLASIESGFYLSESLAPDDLRASLAGILQEIERLVGAEEEDVKVVSIEEKINELMVSIGRAVQASFNEIKAGKKKGEVVIMFLALLHLLKDAAVNIEQEELFADIKIAASNV